MACAPRYQITSLKILACGLCVLGSFKLTSSVPSHINLEGPLCIVCLKVLGALQTDMIHIPSYQFEGPLTFSSTKSCLYLIGDLATDKYYIVPLVYINYQLQGPLLTEVI